MRLLAVGCVMAGTLVSACFFGPTPQQETGSRTDHFTLREYLSHKTAVEHHAWRNTGERATLDVLANAGPGSVKVQLLDTNGTEVFSRTFTGEASSAKGESSRGAPGEWTVRLIYRDAIGNIAMRADAVKEGEEE